MVDKYVFTGPMVSGKSSLIKEISLKIQVYTMAEVAQYLLNQGFDNDAKPYEYQKEIFKTQLEWENDLEKNCKFDRALLDRSLIDGKAYLKSIIGLDRTKYEELDRAILNEIKKREEKFGRYKQVFMCAFLTNPDKKCERKDIHKRDLITQLLWEEYEAQGYKPIYVSEKSLGDRLDFVLDIIKSK
jgi:predicted ATPase